MKLTDVNWNQGAKTAETARQAMLKAQQSLSKAPPGKSKNDLALTCISELIRFANEIEHNKREIISRIPDFDSISLQIQQFGTILTESEENVRRMGCKS
jgi:hypothetical protein